MFNTATHTINLIKQYIGQQNKSTRGFYSVELIEIISPIDFALSLYDDLWEVGRREGDSESFTLSLEQLQGVEKALMNRLFYKVSQSDLFNSFDESEFRLFLYGLVTHGADLAELNSRTTRFLDDDRKACLTLISLVAPTIITSRLNRKEPTREYIKSELKQDDFNLLEAIVDIEKLYKQTLSTYDRQEYIPSNSDRPYSELTDMELVGQFQNIYEQVKI